MATQLCANAAAIRLFIDHVNDGIQVPTSGWFPGKITRIEPNVMESRCRCMLDDVIGWARSTGMLKNIRRTLIMDLHFIARYDKTPNA